MTAPFFQIDKLSASYGAHKVLRDVTISLDKGDVLGIVGPSGSGKSSLLRALVGLLKHEAGRVTIDGQSVDYDSRQSLMAARSRVAIVFQHFNLFQNMTALRNVTLAPRIVKQWPADQVDQEGIALLKKVGLGDKLHAYPDELSGGQQQRVAIARAVALKPHILLLDEVTSALDPELVNEVLDTIRLLAKEGMTMLIVSHEMEFIQEISSRVVMFDGGQIIETGSTREFFESPRGQRATQFLSRFARKKTAEKGSDDNGVRTLRYSE